MADKEFEQVEEEAVLVTSSVEPSVLQMQHKLQAILRRYLLA